MIEITKGSLEEQIIKILQKKYPVTINDIRSSINLSEILIIRVLQKLQTQGIVQLEPLPNKTYIRLIRRDFKFVGKRRQRKFIKHHKGQKPEETDEYDGIMYS